MDILIKLLAKINPITKLIVGLIGYSTCEYFSMPLGLHNVLKRTQKGCLTKPIK